MSRETRPEEEIEPMIPSPHRTPLRSCVLLLATLGCASSYTISEPDAGPADASPPVPRDADVDADVDADTPPPDPRVARPIFGGHGLVAGGSLYFANPETDQIFRYTDAGGELEERLRLAVPFGSAPFRLADADGVIFVTLRGAGSVARIEADALLPLVSVCDAPRGVAWDGARVLVACAGGELVTLDRDGREQRRVLLEPDLRDVVVDERGTIFVSLFRAADVLELDAALTVRARHELPDEHTTDPFPDGLPSEDRIANTAWRMRAAVGGGVEILHQLSTTRLAPTDPSDPDRLRFGFANQEELLCERPVVANALTRLQPTRTFERTRLGGGGLAVDFTRDPTGEAHVAYGAMFYGAVTNDLLVGHVVPFVDPTGARCVGWEPYWGGGGGLSVEAFAGSIASHDRVFGTSLVGAETLLPPPDREWEFGVGPLFFHGVAGVPITCASCHAEGRDDGLVWDLGEGPRRTPSLAGGLLETAPFGWNGGVASFDAMMDMVFVGAATPVPIEPGLYAQAVEWMNRLPVDAATADPMAAARGAEVFATAGCDSCHAGEAGTQPESVDLDGGLWQVPSLRGVGLRFPYFHDGCAPTLRAALDGCEDRAPHPGTEALSTAERDDLAAYLAVWD